VVAILIAVGFVVWFTVSLAVPIVVSRAALLVLWISSWVYIHTKQKSQQEKKVKKGE
jgi:hypothetical protein